MHYKHNKKYTTGIGIIEIIIGTGIITLSLVGIVASFNLHFKAGIENTKKIQALYLLEEGVEILQYFRNNNWDTNIVTLPIDTPLRLVYNGLFWETTTNIAFIDDTFERTIEIHDVYRRDSDSDFVDVTSPDAKTLDLDARHITVSVSWEVKSGSFMSTTTETLEAYVVNFLD